MVCLGAVPKGPSIEIPPLVFAYLKKLGELRIYGSQPGAVATFILRKEIMRLVEARVLKETQFVEPDKGSGDEDEVG